MFEVGKDAILSSYLPSQQFLREKLLKDLQTNEMRRNDDSEEIKCLYQKMSYL